MLCILFKMVLKHPPMPHFTLFHYIFIVEVCGFSRKLIALQFFINHWGLERPTKIESSSSFVEIIHLSPVGSFQNLEHRIRLITDWHNRELDFRVR